jgi:hypothetical protein
LIALWPMRRRDRTEQAGESIRIYYPGIAKLVDWREKGNMGTLIFVPSLTAFRQR